MPEETPEDRYVHMNADDMQRAPRITSNYVICSLEGDEAVITFARRQRGVLTSEEAQTEAQIAVPEVICHLTLAQFLSTADLFTRQAAALRAQFAEMDGEAIKRRLLGEK